MFEPETAEEEEFIVVIDTHQDWFVLNQKYKRANGEPAIALLRHGSGEIETPVVMNLGVGGYFLRMVGLTVLGKEDSRLRSFHRYL